MDPSMVQKTEDDTESAREIILCDEIGIGIHENNVKSELIIIMNKDLLPKNLRGANIQAINNNGG